MTVKHEQSISELWDNFKSPNVEIIGISDRGRGQYRKTIFNELMAKKTSKFNENPKHRGPQSLTNPKYKSMKKTTTRHILIKLLTISYHCGNLKSIQKRENITLHFQG